MVGNWVGSKGKRKFETFPVLVEKRCDRETEEGGEENGAASGQVRNGNNLNYILKNQIRNESKGCGN